MVEYSNHVPVLLDEVVAGLDVIPGGRYIDCTVGAGGHAEAILEASAPGGQLLGIDADPHAVSVTSARLRPYGSSVLLVNDNFRNLEAICTRYSFYPVHGVLFDLGISSLQLAGEGRGFSFRAEEPLDMRFSPDQRLTAADIVNTYFEEDLAEILRSYGEEPHNRRIAREIVAHRPLLTARELAQLIERMSGGGRRGRIHPATRTFMALRIAVNEELESLKSALEQATRLLGKGGRLAVISFHSLEDRVVKAFMHEESRECICPPGVPVCICGHQATLRLISRKAIMPSAEETERNPRSRSARLRVAERI
ncbi:MAG: 16S rRNA (cytosine(1402)-N(4))-methyltransferase RsmH [Chloroflexi bacterium]|nr:16S rRNA (cytosine(1402)-N(4))-methyltransferase RsmH [Chloroflexota bacterium]